MLRQHWNIFHAIAKRRDRQLDRVDTVVEILSKIAVFYRFERIAVRRTYQTKICLLRFVAADAVINFFLQHPKKFRLEIGRHLSDLV
jgi:hypothetical protein